MGLGAGETVAGPGAGIGAGTGTGVWAVAQEYWLGGGWVTDVGRGWRGEGLRVVQGDGISDLTSYALHLTY